jgi:hypothetical protein
VPNKEGVIRLQFTADKNAGTIEGKILPKIKRGQSEDIKPYLSAMLSSVKLGLTAILADLPVLRPASEAELSAKTYIFKNPEQDNELYKTRKAIHDAIATVFNESLQDLFPDVRFITSSTEAQQYSVTEMTEEEAADHKRFLEDLAEEVRESKDEVR